MITKNIIVGVIVGGKAQKHQSDSWPTLGGGAELTPSSPGWVGSQNNSTIVSTVEEKSERRWKAEKYSVQDSDLWRFWHWHIIKILIQHRDPKPSEEVYKM